jgi:hypothetical protein
MGAALEAFRQQLRELYGAEPASVQEGPREMDVIGFVTCEATVHGGPVRGWARDDGAVVLLARQSFGLVLDAVDFAAEPPGMDERDVVRRLVWLHGPRYELVEHIATGELGLDSDVSVPVSRWRKPGGETQLTFAVRERQDGAPVAILHYLLVGSPTQPFRVDQRQLAPAPEDDE